MSYNIIDEYSKKELTSVTLDDAAAAFVRKNIKTECPQCGDPHQSIYTTNDGYLCVVKLETSNHRKAIVDRYGNECYVIFCNSCGYERLFNAHIIYSDIVANRGDKEA